MTRLLAAILAAWALPAAALEFDIDALFLPREQAKELRAALKSGDALAAEALLFEASRQKPDSAAVLAALAAAHFEMGRYLPAAAALKRADRMEAIDDESRLMLATALIAMERRHWARPELERLIRENPEDPVYRYWLAGIYSHYQWFGECALELEKALGLDPAFTQAYDRAGQCLEGMGFHEEALEQYRTSWRLSLEQKEPYVWAAYHRGTLLHERGDLDGAREALETAVGKDGRWALARYELGLVWRKLGKPARAQSELERAITLDPQDAQFHYALGLTYRDLGKTEKARESLGRFRRLSGTP